MVVSVDESTIILLLPPPQPLIIPAGHSNIIKFQYVCWNIKIELRQRMTTITEVADKLFISYRRYLEFDL